VYTFAGVKVGTPAAPPTSKVEIDLFHFCCCVRKLSQIEYVSLGSEYNEPIPPPVVPPALSVVPNVLNCKYWLSIPPDHVESYKNKPVPIEVEVDLPVYEIKLKSSIVVGINEQTS
jgi:hypothetical protein